MWHYFPNLARIPDENRKVRGIVKIVRQPPLRGERFAPNPENNEQVQ
jgi:hypothetical protein